MMNDHSSGPLSTSASETKADPKTSAFSRVFNRNGHGEKPELETKPTGPPKSVWREYFESAVVTVIMALFGMTFVVQAVKVPTGSMQNTITIGDHLLVNKFVFAPGETYPFLPQREIRRGDIIVFKYPGDHYKPERDDRADNRPIVTNYVKRVIGLPGDRISIEGRNIIVNGQVLPEHRIEAKEEGEKSPLKVLDDPPRKAGETYNVYYHLDTDDDPRGDSREIFRQEGDGHEIIVPQGKYFVMGDNRENSQDSRFWGFVPRDLVIGRAMFVYWSYDESAEHSEALVPFNIISDFLTNTRWKRTGTLVK